MLAIFDCCDNLPGCGRALRSAKDRICIVTSLVLTTCYNGYLGTVTKSSLAGHQSRNAMYHPLI